MALRQEVLIEKFE
ncbi:Protein of unknown function [Lactobacillus helveticus CIRM-BIA 953]|uniref:Uncharacterized protein n=1 Tax=Lactobacillus helveticus CIRM-BIA 953 TaxID=1226335 RepID=U4QAE5_LACHE|nr:Protein of unknown function [Lactobacillus helveticus CIRM-BIA 953]